MSKSNGNSNSNSNSNGFLISKNKTSRSSAAKRPCRPRSLYVSLDNADTVIEGGPPLRVPATFQKHPATFLAIHGRSEVLEGPKSKDIVILQFPRRVAHPIVFILPLGWPVQASLERVFSPAKRIANREGNRLQVLLPFQHSELPEQVFRGVPLTPAILKVPIV
jgi:Domain of unknown function (DUF1330)